MRMITTLTIAAAAMLATAPAAAQNAAGPTNNTDMTSGNAVSTTGTSTANEVGNMTTPTGAAATPGTQSAPLTETANTTTAVTADNSAPAPEKKSFPWGAIGLIGLLGLIPRARRRS